MEVAVVAAAAAILPFYLRPTPSKRHRNLDPDCMDSLLVYNCKSGNVSTLFYDLNMVSFYL